MKILRSHFAFLLTFSFCAAVFLSFPDTTVISHRVPSRSKIFHKVQTIQNAPADVTDVDLFDRPDDSDKDAPHHVFFAGEGTPWVALIVLPYMLVALYIAGAVILRQKISLDSMWQKTRTSL